MASAVLICNMALAHIGGESMVTSIAPPDGSVEAGHCATFYSHARTELVESGAWPFAIARSALAEVTNASVVWSYAYALPSDALRPLRVLRQEDAADMGDGDGAAYALEGGTLYTHQPDAVLVYVRDVTDTGRYPPTFTAALSYLLASYLAGPVIKGSDGLRIGDAMRQRAMSLADLSAASWANASATEIGLTLTQVRA